MKKSRRSLKGKYTYSQWLKSGSRITEVSYQENTPIIEVDNDRHEIEKSELDRIRRHQRDNLDTASAAFFQELKSEFKQKLQGWKDLGFSRLEKLGKAQKELKFAGRKLVDPYAHREEDQKYAKNLEDYLGYNFIEEEDRKAYMSTHPLDSDEHYWALINDFGQSTFDEITPNWHKPEHSLAKYFGWRKYRDYLEAAIKKSLARIKKKTPPKPNREKVAEEKIDLHPFLHYLKTVDPPVINDSNDFILPGGKGAIAAWIDVLTLRTYISKVSDPCLAFSINECINNVDMKPGYFRKAGSKKYQNYKPEFLACIPQK